MSPVAQTSLAALVVLSFALTTGGCEGPSSDAPSTAGEVSPARPVRLVRAAHPLARPELDVGPLDPGKRLENLSVVFKPSPEQVRDRDALRDAQLDSGSPSYHQWLSPEQYAARFGARPEDIARTRTWLASRGLEVGETSRLGSRVSFAGRVADVQTAFGSEMRTYAIGGEKHFAMSAAPEIPAELADVVLALHNTHDFYPRPVIEHATATPDYVDPNYGPGLAPPDWAALYDVTPLYTSGVSGTPIDGSGVTIAVVGIAAIAPSDLDAFRTLFGLGPTHLAMTLVPNTGAPSGFTGAGREAILDTEWAGGIAKGATIDYVYTGANDGNVDDATYYAIEQNLGSIISESWGGCEVGYSAADQDVVEVYGSAANLLGISYFAATGDSGGAGCAYEGTTGLYVEMPAAYPGVTAVGGTEFPTGSITYGTSGYATGYTAAEEAWNEGARAGGGGISVVFSRPAYQSALPTCSPLGSLPVAVTAANMRQLPDVSATAAGSNNPIFVECTLQSGDCGNTGGMPRVSTISGTSASTPSIAGVMALVSQAVGGRLGNVNPVLYALEASDPSVFHDIVTGDIEQSCSYPTATGCPAGGRYGYAATAGYDCATGIGSVDATALAQAWVNLVPTSTTIAETPTQTSEGANVSLSATVAVNGSSASTLGGDVTFTFQSYRANGSPDLSWTLGQAPVSGGTTTGGSAALAPMPIPPGLVHAGTQYVDVVAMYGGDPHHLASQSAKVRITFSAFQFALAPATASVAPGGALQYTATGGVAPVKWFIASDATCNSSNKCSQIDETTGAFTAGPLAGAVVVQALDSEGAEALGSVTVESTAGDGGVPRDAGPSDSGDDAGAGKDGGMVDSDAGTARPDAGPEGGSSSSSPGAGGCSCDAAGRSRPSKGAFAGVALGVFALMRRGRGRRSRA